ncbi:hypothetical protein GCM10010361_40700 [Streptomyces olivaceiscleroticus]|uniref:Uncharacterized protein n=1 Tax=Streptomyces olivaceiscleroticus TaxID=68245 RepID=A0ABN1ABH5_9ACTN
MAGCVPPRPGGTAGTPAPRAERLAKTGAPRRSFGPVPDACQGRYRSDTRRACRTCRTGSTSATAVRAYGGFEAQKARRTWCSIRHWAQQAAGSPGPAARPSLGTPLPVPAPPV